MNIIEFCEDERLLNDKSLSLAQRMSLRAVYGLPMTMEEEAIFKQTTGRTKYVPGIEQSEATFILGRRSGKSDKLASNIAIYESCIREHKLSVGELGIVMVVSSELQRQSRIVFNYILRKLERSPILSRMIKNVKADGIELNNRVVIQTFPCSAARVRGASLICLCADECAFWRVQGKDIDKEVLSAARPGLSFEHSKLIKISTPYIQRGEIWNDFRSYFGKDDAPILVVRGETSLFHPGFSRLKLAAARLKDPVVYETEYLARFRMDLSAMFDPITIDRAVNLDRPLELPYRSEHQYASFCDASGGGGRDSYAICIGHKEGEKIVIDLIRSRQPPFNPDSLTAEYCELAKSYHVGQTVGDKFSGDFASSLWMKHGGIFYETSPKTKSELYIESEAVFNREQVSLPGRQSTINQLKMLVRRVHSGGRDSVDTDSNVPEDEANVAAGLIWILSKGDMVRDGLPMFRHEPTLDRESLEKRREQCWLLDKPFKPTPEEAALLEDERLEKKLEEELEKGDGS